MSAYEAILLVDDDEAHLLIAQRALQRGIPGAEILVAHDGVEALRVLGIAEDANGAETPRRIGAILMDLRMPRLDGWETLQRIRAESVTARIPVIIVSSSSRPDDVRRSYELGANSYVVKRFDAQHPGAYLADAARYWLQRKEPPEAVTNH
jgi:CheY-like chemotaxis protein